MLEFGVICRRCISKEIEILFIFNFESFTENKNFIINFCKCCYIDGPQAMHLTTRVFSSLEFGLSTLENEKCGARDGFDFFNLIN